MTGALRELERLAAYTQYARGEGPFLMSRPSLPHEVAAGINYAAVDRILTHAYQGCESTLLTLKRDLIADLAATIPDGASPRVTSAAVTAWSLRPTRGVLDANAEAAGRMEGVLLRLWQDAGIQVRQEATYQGVNVPPDALAARPRRARMFRDEAALSIASLGAKLTMAAIGAGQAADKHTTLAALAVAAIDGALDTARQAVHVAHGEGRAYAVEKLPTPTDIFASEVLDGRTCSPCAGVDGTRFGSLAEAEAAYPGHGPYVGCLGGARCRGLLVVRWGSPRVP